MTKGFWDYEKEEVWLNEMSAKGLAFSNYKFFRYTFEDSKPGEYIYRIELLENLPSTQESKKYLAFLAESGVEHVSSWARWAYLRKKAEDGSFDLYTDAESRLNHSRRISSMWLVMIAALICVGVGNLLLGFFAHRGDTNEIVMLNVVVGISVIIISFMFIPVWNSQRKKTKKLQKEKNLRA
jgi:uncharacterized membrane protein